MSLKMECKLKWIVIKNGISSQHTMSLKIEYQSQWNVTQNEMSHKLECHSKWSDT